MQLGFVGLLEMDQLLHLWDRLIGTFFLIRKSVSIVVCPSYYFPLVGYLDPNLLAIAAVSVFVHRAETLMRVGRLGHGRLG